MSSRKMKARRRVALAAGVAPVAVAVVPLRVRPQDHEPEMEPRAPFLPDWMYADAPPGAPRNVSMSYLRSVMPAADRAKPDDEDYAMIGARSTTHVSGGKERDEQLMNLLDPRQGLRTYALSLLKQHLTAHGDEASLQAYDIYTDFLRAIAKAQHPGKQDADGTVHLPRYLPDGLWDELAATYDISVSTVRRRVALAESVLLDEVSITLS